MNDDNTNVEDISSINDASPRSVKVDADDTGGNIPVKKRLTRLALPKEIKNRRRSNSKVQKYLEQQKGNIDSNIPFNEPGDGANEFERLLDKKHLKQLHLKFEDDKIQIDEIEDRNETSEIVMNIEEFRNCNLELLNVNQGNEYLKDAFTKSIDILFCKIDVQCKSYISWNDLCKYIIKSSQDEDTKSNNVTISTKPRIVKFSSLKDTIAKVLVDFTPSRYISVCRDGEINILASDLSVVRSFHIEALGEIEQTQKKRRVKLWVTDCICIPHINKLVVATANRDLQFFEMATASYSQQFVLTALPHIVFCMCCSYNMQSADGKCLLFFGTDNGDVHLLTFHLPSKSLFETPFKKSDSSWKILFSDLSNHSRYVSHHTFSHLHSDWVKHIQYYPAGEILISCSNSAKDSLVYQSINERKRKSYIFKVTKGIECFDYNKELSLLVTGGLDRVLRFWDPYVVSRPMAILKTHQTSIIDLKICEPMNQVFSYSKDGVLCLWDVKDQACLQSIHIKFPFMGMSIDHGFAPLCMSYNGNNSMLISANDSIAEFKFFIASLQENSKDSTHTASVVAALFMPKKNQIVSVSENGEKFVWDIMSGEKILTLKKFIDEEISAVCVDEDGEFLVTGTRDGTGHVWNLKTGMEEIYLEPYMDAEITSIIILPSKNSIFMFGWSKKIMAYYKHPELTSLKADKRWLDLETHKCKRTHSSNNYHP